MGDIARRHTRGQPVLIGTTSVERSEYLSRQFQKRRVPHNVLNAKYHEQEAGIIVRESGLDIERASGIVAFGVRTRRLQGAGLDQGASTRMLIHAAAHASRLRADC